MDPDPASDYSFVLLGNTGVGKSASGNTLLGSKEFESKRSFKSVTTEIKKKSKNVRGKCILVVDTPGILTAGSEKIKAECENLLQSSRVCVFLVVVKIDRFTSEQKEAVEAAINVIGDQGLKNSYLLFTGGEALGDSTIEAFISDSDGLLPPLIERFERRYHVFKNEEGGQEQVQELFEKVEEHQSATGRRHACSQGDVPTHLLRSRRSNTNTLPNSEPRRVVLLGLPGVGKSSTGNTILGSKRFKDSPDFGDVTMNTEYFKGTVEGRSVTVVDTPGLNKDVDKKALLENILTTIQMSDPGPHAFVFVVKIGRFSMAESALPDVLRIFGTAGLKHSMVLFTNGGDLESQTIEDLIEKNSGVSELVRKCGNRYCVFENKRVDRQQVRGFLDIVDKIVTDNNGQHYTSDLLKDTVDKYRKYRNMMIKAGRKIMSFLEFIKTYLVDLFWKIVGLFERSLERINHLKESSKTACDCALADSAFHAVVK